MSTISWKLSLVPAAALALLPALSGCDEIECGDGTVEVDGVCEVDVGFDPDDPICGDGTHLEDGACVPDLDPTICEPGTTLTEQLPDGTYVCVGVGGAGCETIRCETADGGKVSMCGRIHDVETGARIEEPDATGQPCGDPTADGPCSLRVLFYDPLAFAANPSGTAPLDADLIEINDCGHFKGINITRPFNGFMAIATDDHQINEDAGDTHVRNTGISFGVEMGETRKNLRAFVISEATDEAWTSSAGAPFGGQSFVDKGVYGVVYRNPGPIAGDPVEEVVITAGGATKPADDYYFDDTDAETRLSVDASLTSTAANGTGLLVNSSLGQHSGTGGEPSGCEWESELATSIPTVLFFRETFAHTAGDPDEACAQ